MRIGRARSWASDNRGFVVYSSGRLVGRRANITNASRTERDERAGAGNGRAYE